MNNLIENILNKFSSISLKEMESVSLMKRTDTKFILHQNQLANILLGIKSYYKILEIKKNRIMTYESLYFDTNSRKFYYDHHNGKINRTKVRMRKYIESEICFLEIKQKDGKGNTKKSRIPIDDFMFQLSNNYYNFIKNTTSKRYNLSPVISNKFNRFTLVNKTKPERVTVDMNLSFSFQNSYKSYNDLVIIEVKQERLNLNSPIVQELRRHKILPYRISKYCLGMSSLYKELKYNNFKQKILKINKLIA